MLRALGLSDFLTGLPAYRGLRRHFLFPAGFRLGQCGAAVELGIGITQPRQPVVEGGELL